MILVTGGTGLVGSHLLYFLIEKGLTVRALYRKDSDIHSVKDIFSLYTAEPVRIFKKIQWKEADLTDIPALTEAFEDVTHVYHCAAMVSFDPSKYRTLKKINVEGTANIVNLCLAKKISKLCYVSSVAVFGGTLHGKSIDETTSWNPDERNNVYSITKYGAEMEVWRGTQEGLDAVIVNPGVILGESPHNDGSSAIFKLGTRGVSFYPTGGTGFVDVRDVVKSMILLMTSEVKNEQYILVGENISYRDLLNQLADLHGNSPAKRKLPKSLMLFLSSLDWVYSKLTGSERRLPKANVLSMYHNSKYDPSKIKEQFGFEFTPIKETLKRVVNDQTSL